MTEVFKNDFVQLLSQKKTEQKKKNYMCIYPSHIYYRSKWLTVLIYYTVLSNCITIISTCEVWTTNKYLILLLHYLTTNAKLTMLKTVVSKKALAEHNLHQSANHNYVSNNTDKPVGDWISAPSPNFVAMATRVGPTTLCMVPLNRPSSKTPW